MKKQVVRMSIYKVLLIGLVCTLLVSYPNLVVLSWKLQYIPEGEQGCYLHCAGVRALLFWLFSTLILLFNIHAMYNRKLPARAFSNMGLTLVLFLLYRLIIYYMCPGFDRYIMISTFQFIMMGALGLLLGYTEQLNDLQKKKDEELQQMKIESLQSRCTALTNQINPHFFFNSLNGISSLVRKKDDKTTIDYIDHLSDIFRYILQSERKGLVTVEEEVEFACSFSEVMQVRYAGKFDVAFDIPAEYMDYNIPVLALLPLIENVTVHNIIDSEHRMQVTVSVNEAGEMIVTNPIYPKQYKPETHGTGLKNLRKRFSLLMDTELRIEDENGIYKVIMPLKK